MKWWEWGIAGAAVLGIAGAVALSKRGPGGGGGTYPDPKPPSELGTYGGLIGYFVGGVFHPYTGMLNAAVKVVNGVASGV